MATAGDDAVVSFTVKELLHSVRADVAQLSTTTVDGFHRVESRLDSKADRADLVAVHARLDEHEEAIRRLKDTQTQDETEAKVLEGVRTRTISWRWSMLGAGVGLVLAAGEVAQLALR